MKRVEKIDLISQIGRELQSRMTYTEIDIFLAEFGIDKSKKVATPSNSKWVYSKDMLAGESDELVLKIADELSIQHGFSSSKVDVSDTKFWKNGHFRLFISHLSTFRETTHHLKAALSRYCISSFVAHDDIEPTKEWQDEIEKALFSMDCLLAILMPDFGLSKWTDQEVGVAIGRNKLVIPLRRGLDPYGFIGKYQGLNAAGKTVEDVARGVVGILFSHKATKQKMISCFAESICSSPNEADVLVYLAQLENFDFVARDILMLVRDRFTNSATIINGKLAKQIIEGLFKKYEIPLPSDSSGEGWTEDDIPF